MQEKEIEPPGSDTPAPHKPIPTTTTIHRTAQDELVLQKRLAKWKQLEDIFSQLAKKGQDGISLEEFQDALKEHHIELTDPSQVQGAFNAMDLDGDQRVTFKELYLALEYAEEEPALPSPDLPPVKHVLGEWIKFASKPIASASIVMPQVPASKIKLLLAGAAAGVVSRTSTAPIERVKVMMQVRTMQTGNINTVASQQGIVQTLRNIVRQEGPRGLYRGNGTNVARVAPSAAVRFASFEFFKNKLKRNGDSETIVTLKNLAAGAGAGIMATATTHPLDLIRSTLAVNSGTKYRGAADAAKQLFQQGGVSALYRGVLVSTFGVVPYTALNFASYEMIKRFKVPGSGAGEEQGKQRQKSVVRNLVSGGIAGTMAMTATYPLELLRRRTMVADGSLGAAQIAKELFKAEGWRGFYRGIAPNYLKVMPNNAIAFGTFEAVKKWLVGGSS
jgi:solute carrier family 25 (mitochondrial phosphate transporter), member 23/24/25/41